ncbi:cobyrinic acid a,c-diamide synthase [Bacillus sp. SA1-12]|uniref:cobyrinate a,c-diamide synthase n=1 Tax=Bacillus sp. SA1-12 TaxID=1455638 RepID=UPI000626F9DA|nr:cobyrinate a,c-diamide synthase [Bacillus sp. SA1-12]KKI90311.1 cobyrinic acid a,c-diamide synthase [Bacillus sp. SA1-12]
MTSQRLVIAGVSSGVGKTTITIGLLSALKQRGLNVQGFKCGPDYIDTTFHSAVTGRPSRNLDSWMFSKDVLKEVFINGSDSADISIIEGVMGFYDGKTALSNQGSTAEISMLLDCPTILIVDCSKMARSAAAMVKGFQLLEPDVNIVGVIANKVGSMGHFQIIKEAVEQECGIPVCGYLLENTSIQMPERHLGLIPSIEHGDLTSLFDQLANLVEETIDLDLLVELSKQKPLKKDPAKSIFKKRKLKDVKLAIAKDRAFNFYYQENLELLEAYGAECIYFSPLSGEAIPDEADGLYIGGGFPEQFAADLANQVEVKNSIKRRILKGLPTLAECGGYMYLAKTIETIDGSVYPMVGVIPGTIKMGKKLAGFGYREVSGNHDNYLLLNKFTARGHEFHYSSYHESEPLPFAYHTKGSFSEGVDGCLTNNVIAGYTHLHFASCPELVENFIRKCLEVKNNGKN